ncbi:helix-turn-helix domain-containing protein [Thermithiobacillus plumbiphilus]|uniref:Helix-turn-helix domain-containing protein n=1 Tax=Thermithiobacillus plumbiphilus TaxID=1729899 RepID=A0ABU9D4I2_9PROT
MTKRNIGQEILEGIQAIQRGEGRHYSVEVPTDVKAIREHTGLSQSAFAALLGVSPRTLQDWEQGRRQPSGAAKSLLFIAAKRPEVLREVFKDIPSAA